MTESIDNTDEATVLGYFETLESTFFAKLLLVFGHRRTGMRGDHLHIACLPPVLLVEMRKQFPEQESTFNAIERGNPEVFQNLMEDVVTSLVLGSWNAFEHIIKDLVNPDHAHNPKKLSVDYRRKTFDLSAGERADLKFFEYVRHAIVHRNGAYYAAESIDHVYRGARYTSKGHVGQKIVISPEMAYWMLRDLERLACKAWSNYKRFLARRHVAGT